MGGCIPRRAQQVKQVSSLSDGLPQGIAEIFFLRGVLDDGDHQLIVEAVPGVQCVVSCCVELS